MFFRVLLPTGLFRSRALPSPFIGTAAAPKADSPAPRCRISCPAPSGTTSSAACAGAFLRSLVYSCQHFRREMIGLQPPVGIYTHIDNRPRATSLHDTTQYPRRTASTYKKTRGRRRIPATTAPKTSRAYAPPDFALPEKSLH